MKKSMQVILTLGSMSLVYGQTTERVGLQSDWATLSANGNIVVYVSSASDLVPGDTNGREDIFVYDRTTGVTQRVSVDSLGGEANHNTRWPAVNADGTVVAFASFASNLVPGDTNGYLDVFVHDRTTGVTERVSVDSSGVQGNCASYFPALSADGSVVVFNSCATNLVAADSNGFSTDVFVHDRTSGITELVSVDSLGVQGDSESEPSVGISADGNLVVFLSRASNLVPGDTNGRRDVFVHDRASGVTERVSVDSAGSEGNGYCYWPAISADGNVVAFFSDSDNLVPGDTNGWGDTFVHDRTTGVTEKVGEDIVGSQAFTSLSADGRLLAFDSGASNLVAGDTNGSYDIFLYDRIAKTIKRVSVDSSGTEADSDSVWPMISADGRVVVFASGATNLVPDDTNGEWDVFVYTEPSNIDGDALPDLLDPCPADPADLCNPDASAAAEVSALSGGTVQTADSSVNLAFDPGDLSSDATISVTEASSGSTPVDITLGGTAGVGEAVSAYKFEPDGLTFDSPVTLTLVADVTLLTPEQRAALTLYLFEDTDADGIEDAYVPISGTSCSVSENPPGTFLASCTAEITHFSTYALVSPKDTDGDGVFDNFPPDYDPCPDVPEGMSSLFYIGSLLVPTDGTGVATLELAADLLDSSSVAVAGAPVLLSLTGSNGSTLAECAAVTGVSNCLVSGAPPDVYTVGVTYDGLAGCYEPSSDAALVVVFDPNVPRATGGGFILPDTESTVPAQTSSDKANFGFVVYINKQSAADGNLEFQYKSAGINLKSQWMSWYTVSANKAMFQGLATINGLGPYTFRVQATDGDKVGQPDHFDIVIWQGTDTEAAPVHRAKNTLAGGHIVIQKK